MTATDMHALQLRAAQWHRERFPGASVHEPVLKAVAEMGELAEALLSTSGTNTAHPEVSEDEIGHEAADVVICLLVLMERFLNYDLGLEVHRKLMILEDPDSGHPAAASH